MLLVIDIGNTNIVFGVYKGDTLVNHWRLSTAIHKTVDEYAILLNSLLYFEKIKLGDIHQRYHILRRAAAAPRLPAGLLQVYPDITDRRRARHKDGHADPV